MIANVYFTDMVWYSTEFLEDLAEFLLTPPVFWFVVFGILFYIGFLVKKLVS